MNINSWTCGSAMIVESGIMNSAWDIHNMKICTYWIYLKEGNTYNPHDEHAGSDEVWW